MHPERGVFPGQWGFPGGGVEPGEKMRTALRRELREELGTEVEDIQPAFFKDAQYEKAFADGSTKAVYMIFLIFRLPTLPLFSSYRPNCFTAPVRAIPQSCSIFSFNSPSALVSPLLTAQMTLPEATAARQKR